jgi:hypothetical protein
MPEPGALPRQFILSTGEYHGVPEREVEVIHDRGLEQSRKPWTVVQGLNLR